MGNLIDEILQLSRLSRRGFERVPVDMSALAREIAAELDDAEPDRPVEVEIEDGLLAQADLALVRSVLKTCPVGADVLTSRSDRQARRRLPTDRERPSVRRSRRPLESKGLGSLYFAAGDASHVAARVGGAVSCGMMWSRRPRGPR